MSNVTELLTFVQVQIKERNTDKFIRPMIVLPHRCQKASGHNECF